MLPSCDVIRISGSDSTPPATRALEAAYDEDGVELDGLGMFKADLVSFTRYYEFMSQIIDYDSTDLEKLIIERLNEVFITEGLTENDMLNYAYTVRDKISENVAVMQQIENNSPEQAMLGDYAGAFDDAVMESSEAHRNQMNQILSDKNVAAGFGRIVFDLLVAQMKGFKLGAAAEGPPSSRS